MPQPEPGRKTILQQERERQAKRAASQPKGFPAVVYSNYTSLPVPIPDDFLAALPDPSIIKVERVKFEGTPLNEYKAMYAVVLDDVLSQEECDELIKMAEMSTGAHGNHNGPSPPTEAQDQTSSSSGQEQEISNNGWRPAMVNAGRNHEVLALDYRNSDRIIWDEKEVTTRLWNRVMQGEGMKEYFSVLDGTAYTPVIGPSATRPGERWVITKQGLNERMRFLKYGPGQFFKEHCDGTYETPDGSQRSFYTYHIYLNDSAQALDIPEDSELDTPDLLRGGATTFHSNNMMHRIDVNPKAGRVLIFQHRRLLHSGDEVTQGIKYTLRSDLMYEWEAGSDTDFADGVVFE